MTAKYVLGVDLGTTNNVLAYVSLDSEQSQVELLSVPQVTDIGAVESRNSLASFVYLPPDHELKPGAFDTPWAESPTYCVGEFARRKSAEAPERTIGAAKSWLAYSRVDRHQPILPWGAPDAVPKISPVTASRRYLEHLVAAWESMHPEAPVAEQRIVLTVPASFDASARELTREAALAAGLPANMVLLEEPQAAVYSWLLSTGDRWRKLLSVDDALLVCDVGGGTTDLTLIRVEEEGGELLLQRAAVGRHLLVGGDNMDLALAHFAAELFSKKKVNLDPWQSVSLWHACRGAKEALLAPGGTEKHTISVLGRGSKLIGGTVSVEVKRAEVSKLLIEGFFPSCTVTDRPQPRRVSGFQQIGLPFESDTAVTRHLAAFLQDHGDAEGPVRPSRVLFNGGVFKSPPLRDRLLEILGQWTGKDAAPKRLEGEHDLDHAVARGAAFYGWTKQKGGVRIRGGIARSYYVGIETSGLAVPGAPRPLNALCVAPFGMEEGTELQVPSGDIGLVVGEPAKFRFFSSPMRKQDEVGQVLTSWHDHELAETDSLETTLDAGEVEDENYTPVRFETHVTELGIFELWCVSTRGAKSWKLEFNVRDDEIRGEETP